MQGAAEALSRLVAQLSATAAPMGSEELAEMLSSPAVTVLVACNADQKLWEAVVGTLTLVTFRIPSGVRAWIEDVVVDSDQRGHGVARALVMEATARARAVGARNVDLTSRPSREAANRLYARLGFERRETNVYRLDLS